MATSRSKTLSKMDLLSGCNEAIICGFERNLTTSGTAHIFDVMQHQMQRLMAWWYDNGNIAPVQRPGQPHSAQWTHACSTIAEKVAPDPVWTVMDLSRESVVSRTTGRRAVKELGLWSCTCERQQKLTALDKTKWLERARGLL